MSDDQLGFCDQRACQTLVTTIEQTSDQKSIDYVAKTFPSILLDIVRQLTEKTTNDARSQEDPATAVHEQLKPFFVFGSLLGKCPQISTHMYSYFRNSSFQPLPENLLQGTSEQSYTIEGFDDELVKKILSTYLKYLQYDLKWFSSAWNWAELGRLLADHSEIEIRYLAHCCLSAILGPTRNQHISCLTKLSDKNESIIDLQIKYRHIYDNTFKPCIETKADQRAKEYAQNLGFNQSGYEYCSTTIARVANILLPKFETTARITKHRFLEDYAFVPSHHDTISKVAYCISICQPFVLRGSTGTGKTSMLDYIAATTNRYRPPQYVKVQVCDQIDSKLLIGTYVSTEVPGQFEWQPGPLTKAMIDGSWLVFEDIDYAPSEMLQVIKSVIENGNLSCVSNCPIELNKANPEFRIMFTGRDYDNSRTGHFCAGNLIETIQLPPLSDSDLVCIMVKRFRFEEPMFMTKLVQIFRQAQLANEYISYHELFRLCSRVKNQNIYPNKGEDLDVFYLDAMDCYSSKMPQQTISNFERSVAEILNLCRKDVERLRFNRIPEIRESSDKTRIGRVILRANPSSDSSFTSIMAHTKRSLQLMERIGICINLKQPVLLVGETGVGKTSVIQYLSQVNRDSLIVVNLSQQSDSSDLIGGFRPVEFKEIMKPLQEKLNDLFSASYRVPENSKFLHRVSDLFNKANTTTEWITYLKVLDRLCMISQLEGWAELQVKVRALAGRISASENGSTIALAFTDGSLMRAVKTGKWLLLDEVNLAEPEVLQCLLIILDSLADGVVYMPTPGSCCEPVPIHKNFRIFACMNPPSDIGKRDLDSSLKSRFNQIYVDDTLDKQELRLIVESYVRACLKTTQIEKIVNFYLEIRGNSTILTDITGNSPVYSLRTLCRALNICASNVCNNIDKSLLESINVTFMNHLSEASQLEVIKLLEQTIFEKKSIESISNIKIQPPQDSHIYKEIEGFWIQMSNEPVEIDERYILTPSVRKNLQSLSRIISMSQRKLPILIQGNTSVGKTSLIQFLAKLTGNKCYRINNHEHSDLQEYVGRYTIKEDGEISFQEGLLARAMRKGYWIILDELNLAPTEFLEALNRVLDDNRELYIPENDTTVKAHSKFILFATQNPPEEYAGRKYLSRAFRNRFVELHFGDKPTKELETILEKRCDMAPKHAQLIVAVMRELQMLRRESGCFYGKESFMTMRDLLRWGERYAIFKNEIRGNEFYDWNLRIATEGFILLDGRVRSKPEAEIVKQTIEKIFKVKLNIDEIYDTVLHANTRFTQQGFHHIHFTDEFRRMFVQLSRAMKYKEPVLLCGKTGCGKTSACQLYAAVTKKKLVTYNCHSSTESTDFIGGIRPHREASIPFRTPSPLKDKSPATDNKTPTPASSSSPSNGLTTKGFTWVDGPLVYAMRAGHMFLMDEISLADDAVLERINSVLEPSRTLTLTERKGELISPQAEFQLVATMNPGGDYGKKELSPALRNRFTEIYCHNTSSLNQVCEIIRRSLSKPLVESEYLAKIIDAMHRYLKLHHKYQNDDVISIRDILSWCQFVNNTATPNFMVNNSNSKRVHDHSDYRELLSLQEALFHGASLVYFDQFGTCGHSLKPSFSSLDTQEALKILKAKLKSIVQQRFGTQPIKIDFEHPTGYNLVKFGKFYLCKGPHNTSTKIYDEFVCDSSLVRANLLRLARAMQLDRPILLEGEPGVGKTSTVSALAKLTGHELVRINLSEQTDISDLIGADLPDTSLDDEDIDNERKPLFKWFDGPLLNAIQHSKWILLDEMNLASQSVLEGLNACLDHRGEIFIPELNRQFKVNRSTTRIFACQNPYSQGAARKGLPQSFLNRFTNIHMKPYAISDLVSIVRKLHPNIPYVLAKKMVEFNQHMNVKFSPRGLQFNLRNIIYWCDLMVRNAKMNDSAAIKSLYTPHRFVQFVYMDSMRTNADKTFVSDTFEETFGLPPYEPVYRELIYGENCIFLGRSMLPRHLRSSLFQPINHLCLLKYQLPYMESIAKALEHNKMPIIVGKPCVGKRSMVRWLASVTGTQLNILAANNEMDTIELLGSYEQKSVERELISLINEAKRLVSHMINSIPEKFTTCNWAQIFNQVWLGLFSRSTMENLTSLVQQSDGRETCVIQLDRLCQLLETLLSIKNFPKKVDHEVSIVCAKIEKLKAKFEAVQSAVSRSVTSCSGGTFEWIDSILVNSIREGSWLMIENANLMNAATLDRLNSLVEPNGSLSLSERGATSDGIEVLKPHPNFRLILTVDPDNGELSRAMRNRGAEIHVNTRFYFEDFLMLLNQSGFEPEDKKPCMSYCIMQTCYDVHTKLTGERPEDNGSLMAYFGLNYIPTLVHKVRRSVDLDLALSELLISHYSTNGGFANLTQDSTEIFEFVKERMSDYQPKYTVMMGSERYKWLNCRHDLVALSHGDAIPLTLSRDIRIFFEDFSLENIMQQDEVIDFVDIANTSISIKIFLELATFGDFDYRIKIIKDTFERYPNLIESISKQLAVLNEEYLPLMTSMMPTSLELSGSNMPVNELPVDSRIFLEIHHYLRRIDMKESQRREEYQNRWLLSLHKAMLSMIIELVDERTGKPENALLSPYGQSEMFRTSKIGKDELTRPNVEVVYDIYHLMHGLINMFNNRCFSNDTLVLMMPRLFWICYMICKLKRSYPNKNEMVAVSNQIPMLWALTHHKVVGPMINDCELSDTIYFDKKFSARIQAICKLLEVSPDAPDPLEKECYAKIVNKVASSSKLFESISHEVGRIFTNLFNPHDDRVATSLTNTLHLCWSNSMVMQNLYQIFLHSLRLNQLDSNEAMSFVPEQNMDFKMAQKILNETQSLIHQFYADNNSANRCWLNFNKSKCSLDQFAPIWQLLCTRLTPVAMMTSLKQLSASGETLNDAQRASDQLSLFVDILTSVNGLIVSPKFHVRMTHLFEQIGQLQASRSSLTKQADSEQVVIVNQHELEQQATSDNTNSADELVVNGIESADSQVSSTDDCVTSRFSQIARNHLDLFVAFLCDYLIENMTLDQQIVGWTKSRVNICDLDLRAPLIPEYSPFVTFTSCYSIDKSHLKLNSCALHVKHENTQNGTHMLDGSDHNQELRHTSLDSFMLYLCKNYNLIKYQEQRNSMDIKPVTDLIEYRNTASKENKSETATQKATIKDIDAYIRAKDPSYAGLVRDIRQKLPAGLSSRSSHLRFMLLKSCRLIHFGFLNCLEFAPIFSYDPSMRAREKLEVYKSELAHIKLDLHMRNILYYWRTGENLQLNEIDCDDATNLPFPIKIQVDRRNSLEKKIAKLRECHSNRPKSDDGSVYLKLRKQIEICVESYQSSFKFLMAELRKILCQDTNYQDGELSLKSILLSDEAARKSVALTNVVSRCKMTIKSIENTILQMRSQFNLYSDLTTNFLCGLCILRQGLRCLYFTLEQRVRISSLELNNLSLYDLVRKMFPYQQFTIGHMRMISHKLSLLPKLLTLCPPTEHNRVQTVTLKSILLHLCNHIRFSPYDMQKCIPIVRRIADLFHAAWLRRKHYIEERKREREQLYKYKMCSTALHDEMSFEAKEFVDICARFPTYEHVYKQVEEALSSQVATEAERANLDTEERVVNLNRSADLSLCNDICKAYFKFMLQASTSLLGQTNPIDNTAIIVEPQNNRSSRQPSVDASGSSMMETFNSNSTTPVSPDLALNAALAAQNQQQLQLNTATIFEIETDTLYSVARHNMSVLDSRFDSLTLEYNILQAHKLKESLRGSRSSLKHPTGSLKGTVEMLDEQVFNIYHDGEPNEALRLQELLTRITERVFDLQTNINYTQEESSKDKKSSYYGHPTLNQISKLMERMSSFLLTDPLMKIITGCHMLLDKLNDWNRTKIPIKHKLIHESDQLIEMIKSWRQLELSSWKSSLHCVKREFINSSLSDLWFELYDAFLDPVGCSLQTIRKRIGDPTFEFPSDSPTSPVDQQHQADKLEIIAEEPPQEDKADNSKPSNNIVYLGFSVFIKEFLEQSSLGDFRIRLDLVHSFAIQTRFESLFDNIKRRKPSSSIDLDLERLTMYVHNTYKQMQSLFKNYDRILGLEEARLVDKLHQEIRVVNWQGRNLWEMKKNFRVSHQKLNKVMTEYLRILKQPINSLNVNIQAEVAKTLNATTTSEELDQTVENNETRKSQMIATQLSNVASSVENMQLPCAVDITTQHPSNDLSMVVRHGRSLAIETSRKVTEKLKSTTAQTLASMQTKYVDSLTSIEDSIANMRADVEQFHSYKVDQISLLPKDTKEDRKEKLKTCRQLYHGKKFCLTSIFKTLRNMGLSYLRGLNREESLDELVLSVQPIRGIIEMKSRQVLLATSKLINNSMVESCNESFRQLVVNNMTLLQLPRSQDLNNDQIERIRGFALDLEMSTIKHYNSAAKLYRQLMTIQTISDQLDHSNSNASSTNHNNNQVIVPYDRVSSVISKFNDYVARSILAMNKLEKLVQCASSISQNETSDADKDLQSMDIDKTDAEHQTNNNQQQVAKSSPQQAFPIKDDQRAEHDALVELMNKLHNNDDSSLLSKLELEHLASMLELCRDSMLELNLKLSDMMINEKRNHLYSLADVALVSQLYDEFKSNLLNLTMSDLNPDASEPKHHPRSILGSIRQMLDESERDVSRELDSILSAKAVDFELTNRKFESSVDGLIREIKLFAQGAFKFEVQQPDATEQQNGDKEHPVTTGPSQSNEKHLNFVDSQRIELILRSRQIEQKVFDMITKMNNIDKPTNIAKLSSQLSPMLSIYSKQLSLYLNLIFASLQLRLDITTSLLPFLITLVLDGFGLPFKVNELEESGDGKQSASGADDGGNEAERDAVGFGEGGQGKKDASKHIEAESQLDELKKDDDKDKDQNDKQKDDQDEDLCEAHDDAIEMSDDIGGPAKGSEQSADKQDKDQQEQADDQDEQEDDQYDGLDNEMDKVDQEESRLDEKLWSDDELEDDQPDQQLDFADSKDDQKPGSSNGKEDPSEQEDDANDQIDFDDEDEDHELEDSQTPGEILAMGQSNAASDRNNDKSADSVAVAASPNDIEMNEQEAETEQEQQPDDGQGADDIHKDADEANQDDEQGSKHDVNEQDETFKSAEDNDDNNETQQTSDEPQLQVDSMFDVSQAREEDQQESQDENDDAENDKNQPKFTEIELSDIEETSSNKSVEMIYDSNEQDRTELNQSSTGQGGQENAPGAAGSRTEYGSQQSKSKQVDQKSGEEENNPHNSQSDQLEEGEIKMSDISEDEADDGCNNGLQGGDRSKSSADPKQDEKQDQPDRESSSLKPGKRLLSEEINDLQTKRQRIRDAHEDTADQVDVIKFLEKQNLSYRHLSEPKKGEENDANMIDLKLDLQIDFDNLNELIDDKTLASKQLDELKGPKSSADQQDPNNDNSDQEDKEDLEEQARLNEIVVAELCRQLQIVMQPTKMSKYKGDYKSGKRLNMRKIISYIASNYRKDKIWLRRTKPSKRTYNIAIAVDNSSSMSENNCRQMTYQSLLVLAKSLSIIESGALSVLSFGEQVRCIHSFEEPLTSSSTGNSLGSLEFWSSKLNFDEKKTNYTTLLEESISMFEKQIKLSYAQHGSSASSKQLLVIISDGRSVTQEELGVKIALRRLTEMGVLTLFLVVDDLDRNSGKSIVDVKRPIGSGGDMVLQGYMEQFPFPYYVIMRKLDRMPTTLCDALRQWLDLIGHE